MNATETATKWNDRYRDETGMYIAPVRNLLKVYSNILPHQGWALEIAGGTGVSADYLQKAGLQVLEVDISLVALCRAHRKNSDVLHVAADATQLPLGASRFDVICNFYYFERNLIPLLINWLNPGGLIFFETLMVDMLTIRPEIPPEFLLQPGELKNVFQELEIIYYFEGWTESDHGNRKSIGSLVARKPETSV